MLKIQNITIDCEDLTLVANFWSEVLGARRADIGQTGDVPWIVMADPEGNEFCILSPRKVD